MIWPHSTLMMALADLTDPSGLSRIVRRYAILLVTVLGICSHVRVERGRRVLQYHSSSGPGYESPCFPCVATAHLQPSVIHNSALVADILAMGAAEAMEQWLVTFLSSI